MIFFGYECHYFYQAGSHKYKLSCGPDGTFLDFEFVDRKSKILVICFSGAYPNVEDKVLPFYTGVSFSKKLSNISFLFISDPALYLEGIMLGWYAGTKAFDLQKQMPGFIDFFIKKSSCERVVFFGGSGGGFASLYYSRYVDNSLSIIWNPQTNIQLYDVGKWKVINAYSKVGFGVERSFLSDFIDTDLAKIYSNEKFSNRVIYLQNLTDHHVSRDLKPFMEAVFNFESCYSSPRSEQVSSNFYLHLTDWSKNHKPPPKEVLYYLLERLSRPDLAWPKSFSKILSKAEKIACRVKRY